MPIRYFSMGFNRLESKTPADNYSWYRKERRTMNLFGSLCGRSQAVPWQPGAGELGRSHAQ
jgi:hypothetical protein